MSFIKKASSTVICPYCKGKKEFKFPSSNPLYVYSDGPVVYETFKCSTCKGNGVLSELQFAIYKARNLI